jgi:hypothetical protein
MASNGQGDEEVGDWVDSIHGKDHTCCTLQFRG